MEISKERLEEFKEIYREQYGKEISDREAYESASNLLGFVELLYEMWKKEQGWKRRLKENPKGFALEGEGRTCCVCGDHTHEGETWYDKYGIKCLHCQKAIEKNQIPKSVCKNRDSFYREWEIQHEFNIHSATVRKMMRDGKLKTRTIKTKDGKGAHCYIFLKKENGDFITNLQKNFSG